MKFAAMSDKRAGMRRVGALFAPAVAVLWMVGGIELTRAEDPQESKPLAAEEQKPSGKDLKLPGVTINLKERCVDVESEVSLDQGALEVVACKKDAKEHESIVVIHAKAVHVHVALLLFGAEPGSPAARMPLEGEFRRWVDVPPRGSPVGVYLVVKDENGKEQERPISDFITRITDDVENQFRNGGEEEEGFPTHIFLFAGSILDRRGDGPARYVSDLSGNVITISTFGDEVLCLPGVYGHGNGSLMWEVDSTHLPPVGTKVTLRLRPGDEGVKKPEGKPAGDGEKPKP
jgi:hypothetical protein